MSDDRQSALLEFLQTFDVSNDDMDDLSDGVLLFECLAVLYVQSVECLLFYSICFSNRSIFCFCFLLICLVVPLLLIQTNRAPEYFDPTTIARHLGDNWALKSSNLRKLTRNLEQYYSYELKKTTEWDWDISKMARE